jgi:hypothetical protein
MNVQVEVPENMPAGAIAGIAIHIDDLKRIFGELVQAMPAELLGECLAEALKDEPAKRDLLIEYMSDSEE